MNNPNKVRVTITAEDRIGREESLTLLLDKFTAERLIKEGNILNELLDAYNGYGPGYFADSLSRSQYYKLKNWLDMLHHKFYNYTISINK